MLTTWNVKCGIAEHARYLVEALEQSGVELTILGNALNAETPASLDAEMQFAVVRVWHWDNKRWTDSSIDLAKVRQALTELPSKLLLIQHHTGFLASGAYLKVANLAAELGYAVIVEAHNVRDWGDDDVANWLRIPGVAFIVHSQDEHDRLRHATFKDLVVIPLGVRTAKAPGKTRSSISSDHQRSASPLIGGFGFLRPHKGVKRAIQIIAELRTAFPNIRYEGYHALYPGNESETYLEECLAEAERLGVKDNIHLDTQFHEVDDLVNRLSESDCVLLPYLQSSEGASASANVALASGCPIVTSPSTIFHPLRSTVHMVSEDTIDAYVTAVKSIVSDPVYAADLASRSRQWVEEHSYEGAAQRLLEIVERMLGPVSTSAC